VVVPLPPSKSPTKSKTLINNALTVICNRRVNCPILLNKKHNASILASCTIITIYEIMLTLNTVYRRGCSSVTNFEAVRGSSPAMMSTYTTQGTCITECKNIFRYIIVGFLLHWLQAPPQLTSGATANAPLLTGLNQPCATVRKLFTVVNGHRRG
jgi:hypothetical protein